MRLLAATFPDQKSARVARTRLMSAFALGNGDIGVELLAHGRDDVAILAGRFQDDVVAAARDVVQGLGGTLVVDMDASGRNA
jgi:hypothetical protein